jgi:hypothetical protein
VEREAQRWGLDRNTPPDWQPLSAAELLVVVKEVDAISQFSGGEGSNEKSFSSGSNSASSIPPPQQCLPVHVQRVCTPRDPTSSVDPAQVQLLGSDRDSVCRILLQCDLRRELKKRAFEPVVMSSPFDSM